MSAKLLTIGVFVLAMAPALGKSTTPARMTACAVLPQTIDRRVTPVETIRVSFMITGEVPADQVRFTARNDDGGYRNFTTQGNFTKAVMIANRELHADPIPSSRRLPAHVTCALTYVHFTDGSSWSAPQP